MVTEIKSFDNLNCQRVKYIHLCLLSKNVFQEKNKYRTISFISGMKLSMAEDRHYLPFGFKLILFCLGAQTIPSSEFEGLSWEQVSINQVVLWIKSNTPQACTTPLQLSLLALNIFQLYCNLYEMMVLLFMVLIYKITASSHHQSA